MSVSVLLSIYNGEALIERAFADLVAQTLQTWELIVVDDGSTDTTHDILQRLAEADSRIRVVRNDRNLGLAASLNRAVALARFQFFARMDIDDFLDPKRLELQVGFLTQHPEVDVLGTAVTLLDEAGRVLGVSHRPEFHDELVARMYKETPFFHPTVCFRRDFFDRFGGYDETIRFGQDTDLWLRTYGLARFHNLQQPLVAYRSKAEISWSRIGWGTYVITRGAIRNGVALSKGWYGARYALACTLGRLGLYSARRSLLRTEQESR